MGDLPKFEALLLFSDLNMLDSESHSESLTTCISAQPKTRTYLRSPSYLLPCSCICWLSCSLTAGDSLLGFIKACFWLDNASLFAFKFCWLCNLTDSYWRCLDPRRLYLWDSMKLLSGGLFSRLRFLEIWMSFDSSGSSFFFNEFCKDRGFGRPS